MDITLKIPLGDRMDAPPPLPGCVLPGAPFICCTQRRWQALRLPRSRPEAVRPKGRMNESPVRIIPRGVKPLLDETVLVRGFNHMPELPPFDSNGGGGWERKISPLVVKGWLNVRLPH